VTDDVIDLKVKLAEKAGDPGTAAKKPRTLADLLEVQKPELARALPNSLSPDRFARIVLTECKKTPALLGCTPESILGAVMTAAQLGLEPGPLQHCYLIPRKGEATFQLGYRGMIDLARRSGKVRNIYANVVHEGDDFEFKFGSDGFLRHTPVRGPGREVVAVYGYASLADGGEAWVVLWPEDVDERRSSSENASGAWSPWVKHYEAMARKTAIRALQPWLPQSTELAIAERIDSADGGFVRTDYTTDLLDLPIEIEEHQDVEGPGVNGAHSVTEGSPADGSAAAGTGSVGALPPDLDSVAAITKTREAVAGYRSIVARGATARKRELDEFLVVELGLDIDLEELSDTAVADRIVTWLEDHPIGENAS